VQNVALESVVAVPLSSLAPEILPLRVKVHASGLKAPGYAVVPGIRQLKKSRILGTAGHVKVSDLKTLDDAIRAYLAD
jgi:mRNA-degrading endonuclease toxin of MazEF toxin-antitoxin module